MRDVKRIGKVMRALQEIWCKCPDMRFNQLLHALQVEYNQSKGGVYSRTFYEKEVYEKFDIVSYRKTSEVDLFYVEDEDFLKFLQEKLDNYSE